MRRHDPSGTVISKKSGSVELFRQMMLGVSVMAGLTHVAFACLFFSAGLKTLALINVISICSYVLMYGLARRDQVSWAMLLVIAEIVGHAVIAVQQVGWESGFHLYIILIPPMAMLSPLDQRRKVLLGVSLIALYVWLDFSQRLAQPTHVLDASVLHGLHYFNLVSALVLLVGLAVMYYRFVLISEHRLREMAFTDPLTSLRNRRSILESVARDVIKQRRDGRPLSFVLCDVDHFKAVNDQHGHDAGDMVLKAVASVLRSGVREVDHAARWGGEEFLLLLPETSLTDATIVANRLREAVAALNVASQDGPLSVRMTFGVSTLRPDESIERVIERADQALYQGKHAGRNRVVADS